MSVKTSTSTTSLPVWKGGGLYDLEKETRGVFSSPNTVLAPVPNYSLSLVDLFI